MKASDFWTLSFMRIYPIPIKTQKSSEQYPNFQNLNISSISFPTAANHDNTYTTISATYRRNLFLAPLFPTVS